MWGRSALAWVMMEDVREEVELGIMCESCRKWRNGGETVSKEEVREETEHRRRRRRRRPADDLREKGTGALGGSARVMAGYSLCWENHNQQEVEEEQGPMGGQDKDETAWHRTTCQEASVVPRCLKWPQPINLAGMWLSDGEGGG